MNSELRTQNSVSRVYAVGETVFDIIFRDFQPQAAKPGGSAFNAAISLGRLNIPCSFISEVGNDRVGRHIKEFLVQNGVDNEHVLMFDDGKSALSLAFLNENSDAEYDFYKDYPKQRLNDKFPDFQKDDYLLFGSFYGLNSVIRPQMKKILGSAQEAGSTILYDPNFRSSHLDELENLMEVIEENFRYASIVRASDEDLRNIYGVENADDAWDLISKFCSVFIYTANAGGIYLRTPDLNLHIEVDEIEPLSTIGAGDTFNAGIMYGLYIRGITLNSIRNLEDKEWKDIFKMAALFSKEVCLSFDNYISQGFANAYKLEETR